MKTIGASLEAHLQQEVATITTCIHMVRQDGTELFLTEHDQDLVVGGDTYLSALGFSRTDIASVYDLSVDNLEVQGVLDSSEITEDDLRAGKYDFAEVFFFLVNYEDLTQGILKLRRGWLGEVMLSDSGIFKAELRGMTQLYSQRIGQVYTPGCRADLGDVKCGVDTGAITVATTVASVTDRRTFTVVGGVAADNYYNYGAATFTTGNNAGFSVEIKSWVLSTKTLQLYLPAPADITIGDAITFYPGCNKTISECLTKFNNVLNFRGEPYVPEAGELSRFPNAK